MKIPHIKARLDLTELIGRPYKPGGRGPGDFDCWGLAMFIAERTGSRLPELDIPQTDVLRGELIAEQRRRFKRLAGPAGGALVLFRIIDDDGALKWHIGTVLPDKRHFIHTTEKLGVHIAALGRQPWRLFIEGFYRIAP